MQFENQFTKPWYTYESESVEPLNAKPASIVIGETNTIKVTYGHTTQGNGFKLVIAVAEEKSTALSATFAVDTLTITLATNSTESPITPDDTKNTLALIAAKIKTVTGFDATVTGTGVISAAAESADFTDGQEGTVCVVPGTLVKKSDTEWYVNIAPNSKYDANWRKLTVAEY